MAAGVADQPVDTVDVREPDQAVHDVNRIAVVTAAPLPTQEGQRLVMPSGVT